MTSFIIHFHSHIVNLVLLYAYYESLPWSSPWITHMYTSIWESWGRGIWYPALMRMTQNLSWCRTRWISSRQKSPKACFLNYKIGVLNKQNTNTSLATPLLVFMMLLVTWETREYLWKGDVSDHERLSWRV